MSFIFLNLYHKTHVDNVYFISCDLNLEENGMLYLLLTLTKKVSSNLIAFVTIFEVQRHATLVLSRSTHASKING